MPWFYSQIAFLACAATGWLLTAFGPPPLVWMTVLSLFVYLCKVGKRAIALSSASATLLVWSGVVLKAWPASWDSRVPYENIKLWSSSFFLLWVGAIALIGVLAVAREQIQAAKPRSGKVPRRLLLLGLTGFCLGHFFYNPLLAVLHPSLL